MSVAPLVDDGGMLSGQVVGRHVFYNHSYFDGNDPAANVADDLAIATDKRALLPGETATQANYTSYSAGINGVMVDIMGLAGAPRASDFVFRVGNSNNPGEWTLAPAPASISVRHGAGVGGSARITIVWPDNAIDNEWLQVGVRATQNTGLSGPDTFFFGNRVGLSGIGPWRSVVSIGMDLMGAKHHPATMTDPAPVTALFDYNRDRLVNSSDELIVLNNVRLNQNPLARLAPGADFAWAELVDRHVFYNHSPFDGSDPSANADDDEAIDHEKEALLPGFIATSSNYTTFEQGINGVMIDVADLPHTPTASDFEFRVGNNNHPIGWSVAPPPSSISVREGAGVDGSDRVTIIWPDSDIVNRWLQVTVKATANTGLVKPDTFYFGNAGGFILPASSPLMGDGAVLVPLTPSDHDVTSNGVNEAAFADFVKVDVVGRYIFYNQSQFDGNNPAINASDDSAIAPDKQALLPGGTASASNVTSYSRGINGIMIDLAGLPGTVSAADFTFRVGNSSDPVQWTDAPAPSRVIVRPGAGVGGSARVTITWSAGWIKNTWLQVTVKPTVATGLKTPDVFYFGNLVGDGANVQGQIIVTSMDFTGPRNNPAGITNPVGVTSAWDYNRDTLVNSSDESLAQPLGRSLKIFTASAISAAPQQPQRLQSPLFAPGDGGYNIAFAPDLARAPDGTILAIAEGRWGADDHTSQALTMRRSFDGGATWTPVSTIYSVPSTSTVIVHGATTVVDEQTGTIFLLFTLDNSQVVVMSSTDNGATWSAPSDITASVKVTAEGNPNPAAYPSTPWGWYATGPGHGIQLKYGAYAGRLVIGADHRLTAGREGPSWSHIIYSDDHGLTWHLGGGLDQTNPSNNSSNEISVEQATDGRLYMSVRINDGGQFNGKYRGYSYSSDGGATWQDLRVTGVLTSNQVQGTLLRVNDSVVLFASPDNPDGVRRQMTIWASYNNMQTWVKTRVIAYDYAGYSDMVLVGPDTVLLAYNSGHSDGGSADQISLARFNLKFLQNGNPDQYSWYFNEQTPLTPANIDGTTIEDASVWDNRGRARADSTDEAPMYVAGRNAGDSAISLTEGSDYIQLTPLRSNALHFQQNESFTAEFVIRTTDADGVLLGSSALYDFASWSVKLVNGRVLLTLWDRQQRSELTSTVAVNDGQWHHVAVVRQTSTDTLYVYIDGIVNAATSDVTGAIVGIGPFTLGSLNDGSEPLAVDIDAVRVTRAVVPASQFLSSQFVAPPPVSVPDYGANAPDTISGLRLWMPAYDPTRYYSDMNYSDPLPLAPATGSAVHSAYDASQYHRRVSVANDSREVLYSEDALVGAHWRHDATNSAAGAEWIVHDSSGANPDNFDFVQNTGRFTVSTFIKYDENFGGYMTLFDTARGTSTDSGFTLVLTPSGSLTLSIVGADSTRYSQSTAPNLVKKGTWYHIAVVGNGAGEQVEYYITPVTSANVARFVPGGTISGADGNYPTAPGRDLHIGSLAGTEQAAFDGYMVDPAIFDRPLTEQEIQRLFDYTKQD